MFKIKMLLYPKILGFSRIDTKPLEECLSHLLEIAELMLSLFELNMVFTFTEFLFFFLSYSIVFPNDLRKEGTK